MRSILNPAKDLSRFVFSSDAKLDKHPGLATKKVRTFVYCGFKVEAETINAFWPFMEIAMHINFIGILLGKKP